MKQVASTLNPLHARLLVAILEDQGIQAIIQGESLWSARGELPLTPESSPSVWVIRDEDAESAIALIARHDGRINPTTCESCGYDLRGLSEARCPECGTPFRVEADWTCGKCEELNPSQFSHCWNCEEPQENGMVNIPSKTRILGNRETTIAGQPDPECQWCQGTGTRENFFIPAMCLLLGLLFFAGVVKRIADLRYTVFSLQFLIEVLFFASCGSGLIWLSAKWQTWKCPCTGDD